MKNNASLGLNNHSKSRKLIMLFLSTISLSFMAFGGGFVVFPLLRKKYVDKYKWLNNSEFADLLALSQATPGTIIGNATMYIGYRVCGIIGAVVTMIASIIPPIILITIIYYLYNSFAELEIVGYIMNGLQAGVAAVIISLTIDMGKNLFKRQSIIGLLIMLASFALTFFLKFSVIYIILIAGVIGIAISYIKLYKEKGRNKDDLS